MAWCRTHFSQGPLILLCARWLTPRIYCGACKMCAALGKSCRATGFRFCDSANMEDGLVPRFEVLKPVIRTRWAALLRMAPGADPRESTALVTPEMLVYMLDDTLSRLGESLKDPAGWDRRPRSLARYGSGRAGCQCGLHLILIFFLTGTQALRESLPKEFGPDRVKVLGCFNRLAQDEMAALCGVCRHRAGEKCGLRNAKSARLRPEISADGGAR